MIEILIVDDHPIVLEGSKMLFLDIDDIKVDTERDTTTALKKIKKNNYDVYLIDVHMPVINGIKLARDIKNIQKNAAIILYTGDDIIDYYPLVLERKIEGVISKTAPKDQVIRTIRSAARREILLNESFLDFLETYNKPKNIIELNEKEKFILNLISEGFTNNAIAEKLNVTQRTVERYLTQLFTLLNVQSRNQAVDFAKEHHLLY
ncbi:response regulator transcription factor [Lysinibacillus sp. FSL K6-4013]|uniref:response regulator transcription factor n=1 Tax=Lysinibacillus sp. FSL K6-4013 TaxID=2921504 RepID=UPI00315A672A